MPNYRRFYHGSSWFFTVVTHQRRPLFSEPHARSCLSHAVQECRERFPFTIDAWVLLPDHLHAIWTMPDTDPNYSRRWSLIKRRFTQRFREDVGGHGPPYWQGRFWAHCLLDETDFNHHVDYVYFNPVKHGLTNNVADWPWSTFHRDVRRGIFPSNWGGVVLPDGVGRE